MFLPQQSPFRRLLYNLRHPIMKGYKRLKTVDLKKPEHASYVAQAIADFYVYQGHEILAAFSSSFSNRLIFPASASASVDPDMLAKKASLYSECSICILPCELTISTGRWPFRVVLRNLRYFVSFVRRHEALILRGKLYPFPLIIVDDSWEEWPSLTTLGQKLKDERVASYAAKTGALTVFARNSELRRQLDEDIDECRRMPIGSARLLLPCLRGIDPSTMAQVLADHGNPEVRLSRALRELLSGDWGDDDARLLMAMKMVDEEVRTLDEQFHVITREKFLRKLEVTAGCVAVGLSLLAPERTANLATSILGSVAAVDGLRKLLLPSEDEQRSVQSAFYIPWLFHKGK